MPVIIAISIVLGHECAWKRVPVVRHQERRFRLIAVRAYQSGEAISEGYGLVALSGKRATHLVIGCPPLQGGIHVPDADGRALGGWRNGRCGGWCGEHRAGCPVRPPHGL